MDLKTTQSRPARLPHLHNFRGLAIIFIVATHCISIFDWASAPLLRDVLGRVVANGTVFFLFIAGYLFHHLSSGFRAIPYWRNKLRFVVLPYVIVSIPAIALATTIVRRDGLRPGFYDQSVFWQVLEFLGTGSHLSPFWYMPTIIVFYVFAPLLLRIFAKDRAYWLLPLILVVGLFVSRGINNPLQAFVHFLPVWVLGMACSNFRIQVDDILDRWFWVLPICVLLLFLIEFYTTPGTHSWYSDLQKLLLSLFLYALFRRTGDRADRWLGLAGSLSFGIFFAHSYVIGVLKLVLYRALGFKPAGGLMLLAVSTVIVSAVTMFVVLGAKEVLGRRSRYVLGV